MRNVKKKILDMNIALLDFNCRAANVLVNQEIRTVRDLMKYSSRDLLSAPNCGKTTLKHINEVLAKYGLKVKDVCPHCGKGD